MHILRFNVNTIITFNNSCREKLDKNKSSYIYKKESKYKKRKTQDIAIKRYEIN
jgi:hypothetical protein